MTSRSMMLRTHRTPLRFFALMTALTLLCGSVQAKFPDAKKPPTGWTGIKFKLSQDYPSSLPSSATDTAKPWLAFDFKQPTQAPEYMQAVLDYCLAGNSDTAHPTKAFADISTNSVRGWYHVPWLHQGREFMHGLTNERGSRPKDLGPKQTKARTNWAVGFYNPLGGYAIGQVWKNETAPDLSKADFPEGTVSCKLLFTSATLTEAPFLSGSLTWQANIATPTQTDLKARPKVRLLQLDIAIKDSRAPTTGWVFGTFQYEKQSPNTGPWWKHMVPVGLMWGNDLSHVKANQKPTLQWINDNRGQKFHLGFRGLMNGPIDNPQASCMACHGFAQVQKPGVSNPQPSLPGNSTWSATMSDTDIDHFFGPVASATPISASYDSVDYSLQLQIGVVRFRKSQPGPASAESVPQEIVR